MAKPSEKLAASLQALYDLQTQGIIIIQAKDLSRTHRERLVKSGFLEEIIKGWYMPSRPSQPIGESTVWYASFWDFSAAYLNKRFGKKWCLSPEQSLSLHAGNWQIPPQLLVRTPRGGNNAIYLPHKTSLFDVRQPIPDANEMELKNNLNIFSLAPALVNCSPKFFVQHPIDAKTALSLIKDASDILRLLLSHGHSVIAGRLAGAFRNIGRPHIADDIIQTMSIAGYKIREIDPFETASPNILSAREQSPYVNRMRLMWEKMRADILGHFPQPASNLITSSDYLKQVKKIYVTDAYHSLSIEGYRVSNDLIKQVSSGEWNPDQKESDREHRDALAARGYWLAFNAVEKSLHKILKKTNAGQVFRQDHSHWYKEMFSPCVLAGIIKPSDLAGYRNNQVYIRRSMHVPPNYEAVRDLMPAFCDLLSKEKDAATRIVLGHFFFVYIHPYMDGNGRIGRFLMNTMFAAGGYPWIVVPVEQRNKYMAALEEASVRQNIVPFKNFLAELVIEQTKKGV